MTRVDFDPNHAPPGAFYKLLTATILPRPIAWVSSLSADGVDNLAPHSFFTCACVTPPVLQFTSVGRKHSQENIEATGEFVINFSPEHLFEQINATATDFPADVSEFEATGLTPEPSLKVAPPRVADSPAAFECKLVETISFGDSTVIFGQVVHAVIDEEVMVEGRPQSEKLRPLARLGGIEWAELGKPREITRIPHAQWPGHFKSSPED